MGYTAGLNSTSHFRVDKHSLSCRTIGMFTTVIGRNSTLGKAVEQPDCISTCQTPVLICEEVGIGKELLVRTIHHRCSRLAQLRRPSLWPPHDDTQRGAPLLGAASRGSALSVVGSRPATATPIPATSTSHGRCTRHLAWLVRRPLRHPLPYLNDPAQPL